MASNTARGRPANGAPRRSARIAATQPTARLDPSARTPGALPAGNHRQTRRQARQNNRNNPDDRRAQALLAQARPAVGAPARVATPVPARVATPVPARAATPGPARAQNQPGVRSREGSVHNRGNTPRANQNRQSRANSPVAAPVGAQAGAPGAAPPPYNAHPEFQARAVNDHAADDLADYLRELSPGSRQAYNEGCRAANAVITAANHDEAVARRRLEHAEHGFLDRARPGEPQAMRVPGQHVQHQHQHQHQHQQPVQVQQRQEALPPAQPAQIVYNFYCR